MRKDVTDFVWKYQVRLQPKYISTRTCGLLQPIEAPSQVWEDILIDLVTNLRAYQEYSHNGTNKSAFKGMAF